jgi:Rad3-related DNA helicase
VRPKTAALLGIGTDDMKWKEYPTDFPSERRPVIHVPTARINHRASDSILRIWLSRIDQIIDRRLDRKGIIHTVSYARQKMIVDNSRHRDIMLLNDSKNTRDVVDLFKRSDPPCVLVSPSLGTGWDFPYEECEYIVVGKIPFPDTRSRIIKARQERDKDYVNYLAAQDLVQSAGRGMRAQDDRCEVIVIDDNIKWFLKRNKSHLPRSFLRSVKWAQTVPEAAPKVRG